jgi:hypothetical protein
MDTAPLDKLGWGPWSLTRHFELTVACEIDEQALNAKN